MAICTANVPAACLSAGKISGRCSRKSALFSAGDSLSAAKWGGMARIRGSSPALTPPQSSLVLNRYELIEAIGSGAFGTVWRAVDSKLGRDVAVKAIPVDLAGERAEREIKAAARLSHPGVVTLHEAGADETHTYMVSEFIKGMTLGQIYAEGRCSDRDVVRIGAALAAALDHAHSQGVIHRDVKPGNILIPDAPRSEAGIVKLADFGIAQLAGESSLTRTGDVVGTLAYMSPEQASGEPLGAETDLWALAVVVFEGLTGKNPVRGRTAAETARNLASGEIPLLADERPDLPEELVDAVDGALEPDPDDRGTLGELGGALLAAISKTDEEPGTISPAVRRKDGTIKVRRVQPGELAREAEMTVPAARKGGPAVTEIAGASKPRSDFAWVKRGFGAIAAGGVALLWTVELAPASDRQSMWIIAAAVTASVAVLPRAGWLISMLAAITATAGSGNSGEAVVLAATLLPCAPLMWRLPEWWSVPSLAPLLGSPGFAGAWPAIASFSDGIWLRFVAGAVGAWQIGCAELLLGRTLLGGPPAKADASAVWASNPSAAVEHGLLPLLQGPLPAVAAVWGVGAAVLPMVVKGKNAVKDAIAGACWAVVIGLATATVSGGLSRGVLAGALAGAAVAVALRGIPRLSTAEPEEGPRTMIGRLRSIR